MSKKIAADLSEDAYTALNLIVRFLHKSDKNISEQQVISLIGNSFKRSRVDHKIINNLLVKWFHNWKGNADATTAW